MESTVNIPIYKWAEDDRPREKLALKGKHALSNAELLAILISTGTREASAVELGKKVLRLADDNLHELGKLSVKDLKKVKGIGEAKAVSIAAALELGARRRLTEVLEKTVIRSSRDVFDIFHPILSDLSHEEFWVLLLNRANKVLCRFRMSEGGIAGTVVDPRLLFKAALTHLASSIILCHNHPSGNCKPSQADLDLTRKIKEAGKMLDIQVPDHIIIADHSYFSFADEGVI